MRSNDIVQQLVDGNFTQSEENMQKLCGVRKTALQLCVMVVQQLAWEPLLEASGVRPCTVSSPIIHPRSLHQARFPRGHRRRGQHYTTICH